MCFHPPSHQVNIICIVHMEASRHYNVKREPTWCWEWADSPGYLRCGPPHRLCCRQIPPSSAHLPPSSLLSTPCQHSPSSPWAGPPCTLPRWNLGTYRAVVTAAAATASAAVVDLQIFTFLSLAVLLQANVPYGTCMLFLLLTVTSSHFNCAFMC